MILAAIIGAAIALLILWILIQFGVLFQGEVDRSSNIKAVQSWVLVQEKVSSVKEKIPFYEGTSNRPPVSPLSGPIEITTIEQIKDPSSKNSAHKLVADAMYDCWSAFNFGKSNFLGKQSKFCYPCTEIVFSDKVKQSGFKITNINYYLANTKPMGTKSYLELLTSSTDYYPSQDYDIDTSKDQYIFFAATNGISWSKVFTSTIEGATVGAAIGFTVGMVVPGAGNVAGAGIGAAIGAAGTAVPSLAFKFLENEKFSPVLILGPAEKINLICNADVKPEDVTKSVVQSQEAKK